MWCLPLTSSPGGAVPGSVPGVQMVGHIGERVVAPVSGLASRGVTTLQREEGGQATRSPHFLRRR